MYRRGYLLLILEIQTAFNSNRGKSGETDQHYFTICLNRTVSYLTKIEPWKAGVYCF